MLSNVENPCLFIIPISAPPMPSGELHEEVHQETLLLSLRFVYKPEISSRISDLKFSCTAVGQSHPLKRQSWVLGNFWVSHLSKRIADLWLYGGELCSALCEKVKVVENSFSVIDCFGPAMRKFSCWWYQLFWNGQRGSDFEFL